MLISEMEAVLKSLDRRVGRIEQVLPTLATKAELRDESLHISQQLATHCQAKGCPPSQFALAWCLANPILTSIILGPRTMEQFEDNLAALAVSITPADESFVDSLVPPGEHARRGLALRAGRLPARDRGHGGAARVRR